MRIQITGADQNVDLNLPNGLLLNKITVKLAAKKVKLEPVPEEALNAVVEELKRIKKKYGTWELVEVHSADGEIVKITL